MAMGDRLGLGPVELVAGDGADALAPGEVRVGKRDVLVGTLTDPVRLGVVRASGKREMPAADWARGIRIESGAVLGEVEA